MSDQRTITEMFDDISPRYDFLNHLLSFHIDKRWRRKASQWIALHHPTAILDVATGTADLAIRLVKDNPSANVIGVDLSEKMLEIGRRKIAKQRLEQHIQLQNADAARLPFSDDAFDAVTVAFGVRNFGNLTQGLREMVRVAKDGAAIAILEFSHPTKGIVRGPYRCYSRRILPFVGRIVSKHPSAYRYLPESVKAFPDGEAFLQLLRDSGMAEAGMLRLNGGIATLYHARVQKKPTSSQ